MRPGTLPQRGRDSGIERARFAKSIELSGRPLLATLNEAARQTTGVILVALIGVATLVAFVPIDPQFPAATLDSSWAFALNVAVAKGMVFGKDIVFSFGPFASAYTRQYHPATDVQALWSTALIGVALAASIVALSRGASRISMVGLAVFSALVARDALFLFLPFAFVLLLCRLQLPTHHFARLNSSPTLVGIVALQVVALSLLALVKGTFAVAAVGTLTLTFALLARRGLYAAACALSLLFACALVAFWLAAGQPAAALPRFILAELPVLSGYTSAMSIQGNSGQALVWIGILVLSLTYARFVKRGGEAGAVLFASAGLVLFVSYKAGCVRQADHGWIALSMLALMAWILTATAPRIIAFVSCALMLAGWSIATHDLSGNAPPTLAMQVREIYSSARHALSLRMTTPDELPWAFADSLSVIRNEQSLPRLIGSVDIYSYGQAALLARDPQWAPRPVFRSDWAYTPQLEALNAAHLAGIDAPANVLVSVQPIDHRLPALEDGLSWPALLTRYDLVAMHDDLALLRRRAIATVAQPTVNPPIATGSFRLGEAVTVPADMPLIWARIVVRPTPLGKLVAFLDRLPNLNVRYHFADGSEQQFRYIAAMGEAGFVAAPLIETTTDLFALEAPAASRYFAGRRPTTLTISADAGAGSLWATSYSVDFFRLQIAARPLSRVLFDHVLALPKRTHPVRKLADCRIDIINRPSDGRNPLAIRRFLRLVGWLATPVDGLAPTNVMFTLRARKGKSKMIPARAIPPGNVQNLLDEPPINKATYTATADLETLTGNYALGIEFADGGRWSACAMRVPIRLADARAEM